MKILDCLIPALVQTNCFYKIRGKIALSVLCYVIIPFTNEAKDKNNQKGIKFLHNLIVKLNLIIFITNLSLVFFNI